MVFGDGEVDLRLLEIDLELLFEQPVEVVGRAPGNLEMAEQLEIERSLLVDREFSGETRLLRNGEVEDVAGADAIRREGGGRNGEQERAKGEAEASGAGRRTWGTFVQNFPPSVSIARFTTTFESPVKVSIFVSDS